MILMDWRSSRGLILDSMIIFLNLGSKNATTRFPTGCTSSPTGCPTPPTGSPVLLQDVMNLLYEIIIDRMTKKIKSKFVGTIFSID